MSHDIDNLFIHYLLENRWDLNRGNDHSEDQLSQVIKPLGFIGHWGLADFMFRVAMDSNEISQNFAGIGALGGQLDKWADNPVLKLLITPIAQKHNKFGGQINAFLKADINGRLIFLDEVVDSFSISFVVCYFIGGEGGWFSNLTDEG